MKLIKELPGNVILIVNVYQTVNNSETSLLGFVVMNQNKTLLTLFPALEHIQEELIHPKRVSFSYSATTFLVQFERLQSLKIQNGGSASFPCSVYPHQSLECHARTLVSAIFDLKCQQVHCIFCVGREYLETFDNYLLWRR